MLPTVLCSGAMMLQSNSLNKGAMEPHKGVPQFLVKLDNSRLVLFGYIDVDLEKLRFLIGDLLLSQRRISLDISSIALCFKWIILEYAFREAFRVAFSFFLKLHTAHPAVRRCRELSTPFRQRICSDENGLLLRALYIYHCRCSSRNFRRKLRP